MTGNIRWNIYGGVAAFVLTFLVSVTRNVFATTLLRSFYSFLLVFALLFLFRFLLHLILNGNGTALVMEGDDQHSGSSDTGQNVDLETPNDDSLHELLRANLGTENSSDDQSDFSLLKPPKLISQSELNPEELANALRRMSEE